jgi:hypothetical protein
VYHQAVLGVQRDLLVEFRRDSGAHGHAEDQDAGDDERQSNLDQHRKYANHVDVAREQPRTQLDRSDGLHVRLLRCVLFGINRCWHYTMSALPAGRGLRYNKRAKTAHKAASILAALRC